MAHNTFISALTPTCVKAVRRYAEAVSRGTDLAVTVTEAEEAAQDVVFDDRSETSLCVTWETRSPQRQRQQRSGRGVWQQFYEEEEDEDAGTGEASAAPASVRHYGAMFAAIARDDALAQALLECDLKERDGSARAGGSARAAHGKKKK